ncbi:hypothetical protein RFI_31005 [Reticulomyxa filosa]|uniref:RZ-type domain-containing protein n=1 Tax=Reticulomyxa filosa TaxID=46433 RepID=X6LXS4_RETFI|nr:hypothetical protein RFI_31005 [Reticulomyxa filosa]|eukprot:ETO06389.1 hypothetical protein RFI_31005 [Reticulomyxa filosa]
MQFYLPAQDCISIGRLYKCDQNGITEMERQIRQGLKYYLMVELWRRKGSIAALHLSGNKFAKLFGFAVGMNGDLRQSGRIKNIPANDTFQLLEHCNNQKLDNAFKEMRTAFAKAFISNQLDWQSFDRKRFVHLIAGIFTELYLKNDTNHLETITKFTRNTSRYINDHLRGTHLKCKRKKKKIYNRLAISDSECLLFKNQKGQAALEHVQAHRLGWHLVGVTLSLPQSPLSILLHNPMAYANQYLLAMPEDQSASLLQAMAGAGAWLCPNNHLYFVTECTRTNQSAKCPTCGQDIGNATDQRQHTAAKGNRRIGTVQQNGTIIADRNGATEGMAEYQPDQMAPQGYVVMEGAVDDKCRGFNETSIRIARLFVNLILLIHHTDAARSDCVQFCVCVCMVFVCLFTKLGKTNAEVVNKLFKIVQRYLEKIGAMIGESYEGTLLLLHYMIHCIYQTFETRFPNGFASLSIQGRRDFEKYLVEKCIDPVIPFIRLVRAQTGILKTIASASGFLTFALQYLPVMIKWMKLIHSRFNRRLTQEEVEERPQEFSAEYTLRKQWGDKTKFDDTWKGFVQGWNHRRKRRTMMKKYNVKNNNNTEALDIGTGEFKKYLCIKTNNPNNELSAREVLLWPAIDCGSTGPLLATSKMIRLLLKHLATVNNNCLSNCHQFSIYIYIYIYICLRICIDQLFHVYVGQDGVYTRTFEYKSNPQCCVILFQFCTNWTEAKLLLNLKKVLFTFLQERTKFTIKSKNLEIFAVVLFLQQLRKSNDTKVI